MSIDQPMLRADDAEAVRNLIAQFHNLVDQGRASDCLALFAPGARLVFGPGLPNAGTIEGLEGVAGFLAARQAAPVTTRHLVATSWLRATGPDEIAARSVIALFRAPAENPLLPAAVADLEETYVRTGAGWRLLLREVRPVDWG